MSSAIFGFFFFVLLWISAVYNSHYDARKITKIFNANKWKN